MLLRRAGLTASAGLSCYPRDAMLARVIAIVTYGLSVRPSVSLTRAGIVSKRRNLASRFLHHLVAHDSSFLMPNFITTF